MIETEIRYYNAVAAACFGDHRSIKKNKHNHSTWKETYEDMARRGITLLDPDDAFMQLENAGITLTMYDQPAYPAALREISHPPFGLYHKGARLDTLTNSKNTIAIVGTRRATPEGKTIAKDFGRELGAAGFTVISGLAFGIDSNAHIGCLEGAGSTIAVLAGGLRSIYPHNNEKLAATILANSGAIVSEYPLDEPPLPYRFIERNRLISGMAKGVLVVEAPASSGSLATATFALEQNRDVFVVPGSISHPNFKGSHALIRQGAELVTTPEDIFATYGVSSKGKFQQALAASSPEEILILNALSAIAAPADVDKIITMTKLEPRIANQAITILLVNNIIKETDNGYTI